MYLFFDTETSGLIEGNNPSHTQIDKIPRLVSIAWILCDDNRKIHSIKKYIIKPDGWKIPSAATKVHGISIEQAEKEGTDIKTVLLDFVKAMNKAKFVVGHNIRFDRKVVAAEFYRNMHGTHFDEKLYEIRYRDTMHVSRRLVAIPNKNRGGFKFPTLGEMYEKLYQKEFENAHDASADIRATIMCFWRLFDLGLVDEFYATHKDKSERI